MLPWRCCRGGAAVAVLHCLRRAGRNLNRKGCRKKVSQLSMLGTFEVKMKRNLDPKPQNALCLTLITLQQLGVLQFLRYRASDFEQVVWRHGTPFSGKNTHPNLPLLSSSSNPILEQGRKGKKEAED